MIKCALCERQEKCGSDGLPFGWAVFANDDGIEQYTQSHEYAGYPAIYLCAACNKNDVVEVLEKEYNG